MAQAGHTVSFNSPRAQNRPVFTRALLLGYDNGRIGR